MRGSAVLLSLVTAVCFGGVTAQETVSPECENATLGDIVFLIDDSASISSENFQEVQTFLSNIIKSLDIGPQKVQVGLAQHSDDFQKEFLLKDHKDQASLLAAVEQIRYSTGRNPKPLTGNAINRIREEFFTEEAGSRTGQQVPQIAVVITGGESRDEVDRPAQDLRQHGVVVFGIGVGKYSRTQLETIANWPKEHFLNATDNFRGLRGLTDSLLTSLCISMVEQREALANRFADIFFLVDNGLLPRQFKLFKNELVRLVNQTDVGISGYRVGLAQYSQDVKVEFSLTDHKTKKQTMKAIENVKQQLQTNQKRNLGNAMKQAARRFFLVENGGRAHQGSEQFLVAVTGKQSDDHVVQPAKSLKSTGVTVVGVSSSVPQDILERFASPGFTLNSLRVTQLKDKLITKRVETVTEDCKGVDVADIVFVVDESKSIKNENFQLIRTFLHSVVSGLNVSQARVRVGVVTYNSEPKAQFYLNTFKTKAEILQFIDMIRYRGGLTKTGAALNFTRDHIFQEKQGSRLGVQKVVIVITDGKSQDSVRQAAIDLRRMGITVYAVGIANANRTELEEMASYPPTRHVFNIDSFDLLKPLRVILQKNLCNNIIKKSIPKKDIKEACVQKDEADIYFLIDDSGSISNLDFYDMKKFVLEFLHIFRIGPHHVRIGLVKYSDSATLQFDLTQHSTAKEMEKAVLKISHAGGGTNTGKALSFMQPLWRKAATRQVPKYLVVITDGESADQVKGPAEALRLQGVTIFAIGVENYNGTQLHEIAGDSKRMFHVGNFDALKSITDGIFTEICATAVCKDVQSDIFFLVESSEGISEEDFIKMKVFMKSVISKSSIGQTEMQVGVMQFSTDQKLQFDLKEYRTKEDMMKAIDGMEQMNEDSYPGKAITQVSKYFESSNGGRPAVRQVLVLITASRAKDEVRGPAEALRAMGVVIYSIGVMEANINQLVQISGSLEQTFNQEDFSALQEVDRNLALKLCDPQRECKKTEKADIIFLVDGSRSISSDQFASMQVFMDSMVNLTTVGRELTRFGVILYSDEPVSIFKLSDYESREQVRQAINSLVKPDENTYTGAALEYSLQFFNDEHGGRRTRRVPQILMVITDGAATDPLKLKDSSDALRKNQISVFSIGVKDAVPQELMTMAGGDESKVFFVDDFKGLETLSKKIFPIFCNTTQSKHCEKSDLVFLLDHSSSINEENITNYDTMLNFVADMVGNFEVSQEWVRVGLAQFSNDPKDEFYLSKYNSKKEVTEQIRKLIYKGGDTYLGKALKHMKNYFQESTGSRRGIPKTLLLISDGDSHDDVEDVAQELRKMDIEIFAIGIGDIHVLRLLQTTGTPEKVFHVQNFNGLKDIKKKVYDELCKDPADEPVDCNIDVAVGFDISTTRTPSMSLRRYVPRLEEVIRYVSGIQDACCTSPVQTKIAFHVGPFDSRSSYETKFEPYSEDVMKAVLTMPWSQPSFFNSALLNFFKDKFKTKSKALVKVLLIFSDGLDEKNVMKLEQDSELLRNSGVSALVAVALDGANPFQLHMVEFGRGFSHHLPITVGMPSLGGSVLRQIRSVANRICCNVTCECTGHEGERGLPGTPGTKGPPGMKGQQGFTGDEGVPGERGLPGPSGLQGLRGCPGDRGQKGSRSFSGSRGEDGEDGVDAVDGEQGDTGGDGIQGEKGNHGNQGNPGIRGEAGLKGQRGLRGDPGELGTSNTSPGAKGEPGNPGIPGRPGLDGERGVDGGRGNQGPDGRRGPRSQPGELGGAGAPGLPGIPGAAGPQGRRGGVGLQGPDGPPGFPGPQGRPGPLGKPGPAGSRGATGQKGQPGEPGIKGTPGIQGPGGIPGSDGRDGFGPAGPSGAKGEPGFPGYPGLPGESGLQGSKGHPGRKGNQGQGGYAGTSGDPGTPGRPGYPGRRGLRGSAGHRNQTDCELIAFIRDNCVCSHGASRCPAYPTELVFGLDQSRDVSKALFERQRRALLTLLEDITVAESNCPTGARVAVVDFGGQTRSLIRFQEHRSRKQLMAAVRDLPWNRTMDQRQLGAAMLAVGQNIFKRVRSGLRMRKVAIFFTIGPSQDTEDIVRAMMVYRALDIIPVVISLKDASAIAKAMEVDETGQSIFTVLGRPQTLAADLRKVRNCAICYDPCRPSEDCSYIQDQQQPQQVEVDLAMVLDGSREMQADQYAGAQQLLGSVVEQLAVSSQPQRAAKRARVALVQQGVAQTAKLEFGLQTYQNQELMRRHLIQNTRQQGGSSVLGQTLDYTLKEVLLKAGQPGRKKVLLTVVATQTASGDQARLRYVSQKAKCDGVAMFVVTVGDRYNRTQVEELAGLPVQQHLIHVSRLEAEELAYTQRFFRVFLSALSNGLNTYPPPSLKTSCVQWRDTGRVADR